MQELIQIIIVGGLLGVIGQGARTAVGLKKLQDKVSSTAGMTFASEFSSSELILSLFIGFVAGALAALMIDDFPAKLAGERQNIIALLITSGYAGTDFIEGAISKMGARASTERAVASQPAVTPPAAPTAGLPAAPASFPATPDPEAMFAARFQDDPSYAPPEWVRGQPGATETWR